MSCYWVILSETLGSFAILRKTEVSSSWCFTSTAVVLASLQDVHYNFPQYFLTISHLKSRFHSFSSNLSSVFTSSFTNFCRFQERLKHILAESEVYIPTEVETLSVLWGQIKFWSYFGNTLLIKEIDMQFISING